MQAGSPVIGKGKASATGLPAVDMVGNPRLTSGKLDIGAYEYNVKNKLALSAYNVQFGSQPEGLKSAVKTLTLTNQGSGPVAINSIDSGPSFPQTNDCGQSVAASASCHIKIFFAIHSWLSVRRIEYSTDATRNPQVVTVTGTGLPPGASLDLYGFSFPLQIIGTSSAPQTFTLTNDNKPPSESRVSLVPVLGFLKRTIALSHLPPNIGSSCTITVVCTPSQTGFFTGNISIYDNAPSSPQQISLQGTGISAGVATVSTTNLTFPTTKIGKSSAPQTVTLTNTGTGPLGILSISGDGDFPSTNNCPASLLAGGSCVISVIFTPSNNSSEFGSIFIQDDGQPGFINISSTGNGQSVTPILTSLSQGSAPVGIQNLNFIINGTGFFFGSQVFWNQTLVSSGVQGPTQLFVSVPDNLAATVGNAQITVVNPAPGGGTSNTLTFTVYKPLNYDFKTTSYNYISITGTNLNMGPFSGAAVISPFPLQVGGGSYTTLLISSMGNITFLGGVGFPGPIPTQFSSPLVAPFWDSLGPFGTNSDNNVFWQVVGTAPNRKMVVEWRNVPYCCTQDPTSTVRFEVVFSEGSSNLNFNYADTVFGGTNTVDDNGATASVGVQVATGLGTQFSFDSAVLKSKTSLLWFPSDPTVQLSSSVLDFGYHQIGNTSLRQTVTLKNNSIAPLTIDSIAINSSDFSQTNTCGTQLLSGKTCTISAAFRPSQLGAESAQLTINGNEKDAPLSITLNGIGTVDPTEVFPSRIDFGLQAVGSKSTSPVTLANASNQVLSVQKIVASPAAFSQTNNCGSSLAPGASCTVNLTFAPSHKGSVSGTLSMGLSSKPLVTVVQLTGAGK